MEIPTYFQSKHDGKPAESQTYSAALEAAFKDQNGCHILSLFDSIYI